MKSLTGLVISDKMAKGAVVEVKRVVAHPIYLKRMRKFTKLHVINGVGAKAGDKVKVEQCRPVSKTKSWKILEVIK
jgi:small subunit ribosomal protein S17